MKSKCMELSQQEVNVLVIAELRRRHPEAPLPISIDYEPRSEKGFCHCWWIPSPKAKEPKP